MDLYPHQQTGIAWLAARDCAMLLDDQGLGKTITAIGASRLLALDSVLCVVPSIVLFNWAKEWKNWADESAFVIENGRALIPENARVVVVTHGLLLTEAIRRQLLARWWDLLIVDEAHFFRTPSAQRTQRLYPIRRQRDEDSSLTSRARRVWILSGTIMPNDASELWTHLRGLWPGRIRLPATGQPMSYPRFIREFCVTRPTPWGLKIVGNRNVAKLRRIVKDISLRRLKSEVLPDLPSMRFETVVLRPDTLPWELTKVQEALDQRVLQGLQGSGASVDNAFAAMRGSTEFSHFRRLCGIAKAAPSAELLNGDLASGMGKVVVFAHHKDVIDELEERLDAECVRITGETTARQRQAAVQRFQTKASCRVALCQIVAGGTGTTLTAASEVVFVEMSFVPGENAQAADRCHRIGQTERVRARFIALAGTIDEDVTAALALKTRMIREVLS